MMTVLTLAALSFLSFAAAFTCWRKHKLDKLCADLERAHGG